MECNKKPAAVSVR